MVGLSGEVFVDQVEWVPPEEDSFVEDFRLAISRERLVAELVDVKVDRRLEPFLLHPWAAVAREGYRVARDCFKLGHYFGAGEVGLSAVGKDAYGLSRE
jgi:hypothetical protein